MNLTFAPSIYIARSQGIAPLTFQTSFILGSKFSSIPDRNPRISSSGYDCGKPELLDYQCHSYNPAKIYRKLLMVTDVNAVGRMSQCSVYVNCQTSNGECISDPLSTYTDMPTQIQIFFSKRGVCIEKKIAEKNRIVDIHAVNVYEHENQTNLLLLFSFIFYFFLGFICFILLYTQIRRGIHPLPPPLYPPMRDEVIVCYQNNII